mgnify:CR=1 FL=1
MSATPSWYSDEQTERCDCDAESKLINHRVTYSDSLVFRRECTECGQKWCGYIEG